MEPRRILCLNYEYPPVGGGGGRIAHRINAALAARGHAVRVQTAGLRHLAPHETVDGVDIFRAESFRKKEDTCTVPEMALFLATSLLPTLHHIRRWRPHVIHAHFAVPTGALAWLVSRLTGSPYVLTAHLGDVPGGVPEQTAGLFRLVQPFTRPIWRNAAAVTAVSTFVANLAETAYALRPQIILNGVPLGPEPALTAHHPPRLLFVGRLSAQKNPVLAVRALAQLHDLPWELRVIGDGPLRADMETAARDGGIADRVHFLGWLDAPAVSREMTDADALVLSSTSEGLPMAAIEALTHGLAVFGGDIPGLRDVVIPGQNGTLSPLDPDGFAAPLRAALADPAQLAAFRKNSRARAAAFDLPRTVDQYEHLLARVARPNPATGESA